MEVKVNNMIKGLVVARDNRELANARRHNGRLRRENQELKLRLKNPPPLSFIDTGKLILKEMCDMSNIVPRARRWGINILKFSCIIAITNFTAYNILTDYSLLPTYKTVMKHFAKNQIINYEDLKSISLIN